MMIMTVIMTITIMMMMVIMTVTMMMMVMMIMIVMMVAMTVMISVVIWTVLDRMWTWTGQKTCGQPKCTTLVMMVTITIVASIPSSSDKIMSLERRLCRSESCQDVFE